MNPATCKIIVVIIFNPADKKHIKSFLDKGGVPSQFILSNKMRNAKIGVFSNLLKQMNAKLKQDLYRLNLPACQNTMLVGIDIVMQGRNKLIGCCATTSKTLTQCYTKLLKHKAVKITPEERKEHQGKKLKELQEERTTIERS